MSAYIRLNKIFSFEAAHALHYYDGPCKNIHGHSYKLEVCIIGKASENEQSPKNGMVMDFGDLKDLIKGEIVKPFDHALILNEKSNIPLSGNDLFSKVIKLPYQPTCENLLEDFANRIERLLPDSVKLHCLKLSETDTSSASWYAEDQKS